MTQRRIAIITGASGGLGRAFCEILADRAPELEFWLLGRSAARLEAVSTKAGSGVRCFALDFADPAWPRVWQAILEREHPDIAWLINNAGFGYLGDFSKEDAAQAGSMADVDFAAPIRMCALCLPYLKRGARILNVCSVAGLLPLPGMAVYSGAKAGLLRFSRALAEELKPRGISVTALCPYWIGDTGFIPALGDVRRPNLHGSLPAREAARLGIDGACRGKTIVTPGALATLCRLGTSLLPVSLLFQIRKWWRA